MPVAVVGAHRPVGVQLAARTPVDEVGHLAAALVQELALDVAQQHTVDARLLGGLLEADVVRRAAGADALAHHVVERGGVDVALVARVAGGHVHDHEHLLARPAGVTAVSAQVVQLAAVALAVGEARVLAGVAVGQAPARVVQEDHPDVLVVHEVVRRRAGGIGRVARARTEPGLLVGPGVAERVGPVGEHLAVVGQVGLHAGGDQPGRARRDARGRLAVVVSHGGKEGDALLVVGPHDLLPAAQLLNGAVVVLVARHRDQSGLVAPALLDDLGQQGQAVGVVPVLLAVVHEQRALAGRRRPRRVGHRSVCGPGREGHHQYRRRHRPPHRWPH